MRLFWMCLAVVLLAGGCDCPTDVTLNNGDVVDSLYYQERRVEGELMIEMWIDFPARRLRFKCSPHDALGWDSRRFDSWRLDIALSRRELCRIADRIRLAEIESWECEESRDASSTLDKVAYYARMKTANGAVERFVAGGAPMGFEHLRKALRFAATHADCRYENGERTAEPNWKLPYGQ